MAVEDGKMSEFNTDMLAKLIQNRRDTFEEMMHLLPDKNYEVISFREENGFTARLAVKRAHEGAARGIFIVCPGGGFLFKSWNEAFPVAEYFYETGLNVAILDYHVNDSLAINLRDNEAWRMAGEDGLEAIRYLRANARKYNILPDHIAIGGFSAGGLLSGYAATKFDYGNHSQASKKRVSSRPDAALILYGAFSSTSSVPALTGGMTPKEIAEANHLDTVRNIRVDSPPMFVFQTHEDDPRIALNFCMELAVHGVPYEIHTFENGAHGGGLYNGQDETPDVPHTALWASIAADWLKCRGFF